MKNTLFAIVGPTAIGKTKIAIQLAEYLGTEIVSADSRQFYKELKIGVAAPTKEELETVPHHYVGHLSVKDYYNVSRFENDVLGFLNEHFKKNPFCVLVGGSGLYVDAVCKGIDDLPDPDKVLRKQIKDRLKNEGIAALQKQLKQLDTEYYQIVDPNNPNRLLRALEVCLMTGKTYTSQRKKAAKARDFDIVKIGLTRPRIELVDVIHRRVDQMVLDRLVEEVKGLLEYRNLNALNTVGYKEIFNYLDGKWSLDLAIEKIKTHTRRYAKRQMTWFGRDKEINWFHPEEKKGITDFINPKTN